METINAQKEFDCLEMKREIQAKIYAEIKDMNAEERILYFHIPLEQDPYRQHKTKGSVMA
jgi:fibronectin type 3 domain-containing protein